jgi:hypothetical protein
MTGEALSGEFLTPLLRTLAETLDAREVFARISSEARRVVPHDFLILGIMSPDRQRARVIALSGEVPETAEEAVVSPAIRRVLEENDALIWNDVKAQAGGRRYTAWFRPDGSGAGTPIESDLNPPFRQLVISAASGR